MKFGYDEVPINDSGDLASKMPLSSSSWSFGVIMEVVFIVQYTAHDLIFRGNFLKKPLARKPRNRKLGWPLLHTYTSSQVGLVQHRPVSQIIELRTAQKRVEGAIS